ncbi:C-type lectin domain family 4 member E-like [Anticarsia gemmatalis]|uniref:C-type lectin domain family 4 member E-like n=1 Tax=Anticarsia gemmatalis TaxID=129554 RepID=UPI003F773791
MYLLRCMLVLLLGLMYQTDAQKFRCDYRYCNYAKAWFKYHEIPATWYDARLMCQLEGAILAAPTSPEIRGTMAKSTGSMNIFTGFHASISKGKYYTVDGIPLESTYHEWVKFEPNNVNNLESCITMNNNGQISDQNCDTPHPYICYKKSVGEVNICGTEDPEYQIASRTNKCYKFHTVPRNFSRANFACSAEGGHLAIINSQEEAAVLRDIFAKYPAYKMVGNFWKDVAFVGFFDWGEHGDWRTIHGQTLTEAGYDKFSPGEPTNATTGEYCGSIYRTALFNDLWCQNHYAFICEKKPDYPPLCDYTKHLRIDLNRTDIEDINLKNH